MSLTGKVAIVTGGNSGIGKAIALALAEHHANVVIDFVANPDATEELEQQIAKLGDRAIGVKADVSKVADLQRLVDTTVKEFGRLDIMVNNAGVETRTSVLDTTEEQYEKVLDINLKSAFFGTQIAAKQMIKQGGGGRIINITSVHEDWPMPGNTAYCLSKGGMRMLTRTAGVELGPAGILVVGVGPGAVETPINLETMKDAAKMKVLDTAIPLGRMAKSEEIGNVVAFLAGDGASYLTATTIFADGGIMHSSPGLKNVVLALASTVLAVDPLPWARSQMAFTLGVHIILVPLGVSWAAMALIANYRGIKHDDADALLLAQRWSKYMAVTFAVGAVTGTVLTFEFGLLWPKFMGQWGEAFGIPFAFEGLFFFTEAIFIAIYIYGWKRLKPWPHFWTGIPLVITGIGGSVAVVAANSWMNEPAGFTLNSAGKVVDVDPVGVIFNKAMPYEATHMVVAAYLVGGFLIASVYAVGMLRGRSERYYRLGFIIPFTVAAIFTPIQMAVGDTLARWVYENEPRKFAAIELVPKTQSDVPETLFGHLNSAGTKVEGGLAIPGLASILSDPGDGTATVVQGRNAFPASSEPTVAQANVVHLAWDVMVGLGTLLFLLSLWYGATWLFRRDLPKTKWFLRVAAIAGILSVITMEAGWVVTEVGRQPWIVSNEMKVEEAVTGNTGVWLTFIGIVVLYAIVGVTTVLVLRGMSRRWREAGGDLDETDVPYGPRGPVEPVPERTSPEEVTVP